MQRGVGGKKFPIFNSLHSVSNSGFAEVHDDSRQLDIFTFLR